MTADEQQAPLDLTRGNPVENRLVRGLPVVNLMIRSSRTTDILRIARASGHHAVTIDLEHSTMSLDLAGQMCAAAIELGVVPLVRIPERDYGSIGRLLDAGAMGIIAPRIESVAEARTVARACRFPPRGQRSQLNVVPQLGFRTMALGELNRTLDGATLVLILLETPNGLESADEIARVDGVDVIAVGVNDLTAELGCAGRYGDPRVHSAILAAVAATRKQGKLLIVGGIGDLAYLKQLFALGVAPFIFSGTDTDLLLAGANRRVEQFTDLFPEPGDKLRS
jgi:2-keto-3-deoxy-L-rhamnonate aldolase RhmA